MFPDGDIMIGALKKKNLAEPTFPVVERKKEDQ
jgi:hypothetical protein